MTVAAVVASFIAVAAKRRPGKTCQGGWSLREERKTPRHGVPQKYLRILEAVILYFTKVYKSITKVSRHYGFKGLYLSLIHI